MHATNRINFGPPPGASLSPLPSVKSQDRQKPKVVGLVRIYGHHPGPYTLTWRARGTEGPRKRTMRADWKRAKKCADDINTALTNSSIARSQLGESGAQQYLLCADKAAGTGKTPLCHVTENAEFDAACNQRGITRRELLDFYDQNRPVGILRKTLPDLVTLYLAAKDGEISTDYYSHLESQLARFVENFKGGRGLHQLQGPEIRDWLNGLKSAAGARLGQRARHNYRASIEQLANWAKANHYLPQVWAEMEAVPDPGHGPLTITILRPAQVAALLIARQNSEQLGRQAKALIPFLLFQAFAGIRHEELSPSDTRKQPLDWRDVHLADRWIYIPAEVSKTGVDRTVPIADNLAAWLATCAKESGPICELAEPANALTRAKKAAEIPAGKGETRNALRKSFISYRLALTRSINQVAEEAGNSPAIIRKHYRRIIPHDYAAANAASAGAKPWPLEPDAKNWFNIWPTSADVIQLNFGFR